MTPELRRRRNRRAAGTLFFMIIVLPIMWFVGAVAIDSLHVIGAQRRAGQLADAAALAGAAQYARPGEADWDGTGLTLSRTRAKAAAEQLINQSVQAGAARGLTVRDVKVSVSNSRPATVYVTLEYRIEDLDFYALAGGNAFGIVDGEVDRSASVCIPAVTANGARYCARPRVGGSGETGTTPPGRGGGGVVIGTPVTPGLPPVDGPPPAAG